MAWQFSIGMLIMAVAGAISLTVVVFTLRRREAPGSKPLVAVNIIGALWAWMAALELASAGLGGAVFFHRLSFLSMSGIGVAWFLFAAEYAGRHRWTSPTRIAALAALPVVTQVLVWTDGFHGLMFESLGMVESGGTLLLAKHPGIWWWVDSAYTYALLLGGLAILGHLFFRGFGLYRRQVVALIAGLIVPMAADAVFVQGIAGGQGLNWAPALFAWVGLTLYWGFTRFQLLDVTPVAREFVAEHMGDSLVVTDTEDRVTYLNLAAERLLGARANQVVGKPMAEVAACRPGLFPVYLRARNLGEDCSQEWEQSGRYYDGRVSALRDGRERVRGSILVLRDTTDRKVAELALDAARRELEDRVVERTAELLTEKEHLAQLNGVAVEIARCVSSADVLRVGVGRACEAVGSSAGTLWLRSRSGNREILANEGLSEESRESLRSLLEQSSVIEQAMAEGSSVCVDADATARVIETGVRQSQGGRGFQRVAVMPLVSRGHNLGALILVSDDSSFCSDPQTLLLAGAIASQIAVALENARRYEDAQFLAERDSLTRLFNHRGFNKRLEQEVARCERSDGTFGLVMIDVDNFKLFNDAYGHVVGDRALQGVARILSTSLRRSDIIARYGGDEFIAILPDTVAEVAVQLVERIRASLVDCPFLVDDGRTVPLKMSYGVSTFPYDGATAAELLAAADANLYRSKGRGGDFITASGGEAAHPVAMGSFSVLDGLVTTVDNKDHYTRRHSDNVTEFALALASKMDLSLDTQRSVRVAGLLHDVGKLGVPDHILRKPAGLNAAEFEAIKNHVTLGELIIQGIPNQEEVLSAVSTHHERFDGMGYPRGLKGEEIPLLGRILAVTDAYSAMTTDRPYRKALDPEEAQGELKRVAGTQLDPQIVGIFLEVLDDQQASEEVRVALFASGRF